MNKKGILPALGPIAILITVIGGIIFLLFLGGGGATATLSLAKLIADIVQTMSQIPTILWIVLGIIFLFTMLGGKKR